MCPMNCHPTLCGMLAELEGDRVVSVRGDPDNPDSRGFLCARGHATREVVGNPRRLLRPLVRDRRGGPLREATWDEAMGRVAVAMRAAGPAACGLWSGHGLFSTSYGTRIGSHLLKRFAAFHGSRWWNPSTICWGLGALGVGLTGPLEVHTQEDLGRNANLVLLWGANLASQPTTGPHVAAARRRGARIVTIDVRETEAAAQSDEVLILRPGTDAALALALLHVVVAEGLVDRPFVDAHTVGFDDLAAHLRAFDPAWAAAETGIPADRIVALARRYATTRPAMIVLGGSSMHKSASGWQAGRAVACLPALTGNLGVPGGGLGPRHGASAHGQALADVSATELRRDWPPNQMTGIAGALAAGELRVLLLFGTDLLSSFADEAGVEDGLARADLVVSHDLFPNETTRRAADVVLPSTAWLEELGCKATNTHLHLVDRVLDPPGEARSAVDVLRDLARRLDLAPGFFPWKDTEGLVDALLDHPATGRATVAALRAEGGIRALNVSHVAHPDLRFPTPSGKVELRSERAAALGLPALPVYDPPVADPRHPLALRQGRTLAHFHAFYDHGRALPALARLDPEPVLWISPADAARRGLADGDPIRVRNDRGVLLARARVTPRIPPGTVWMHDGWPGLNRLTSGARAVPDAAADAFPFGAGQASFEANVEIERA